MLWVASVPMSLDWQGGAEMSLPRKPRALCACGCGREVVGPEGRFFSNQCQQEFEHREYIERWHAGLELGAKGSLGGVSNHIRRYLLEKYNKRCSECGWAKRHPITRKVPLEEDHINGDASDTREANLRLLCPNCHSLTPNFRNLNKGNGRPNRR